MVIVDPEGVEQYRYQGRDFADRTNDDDLFAALADLDLPPVNPEPWIPEADVPADLGGFFHPDHLVPYFKCNFFGAVAIGGRLEESEARAVARQHRTMAQSTLDAWEQHHHRPNSMGYVADWPTSGRVQEAGPATGTAPDGQLD